MTDEKKEPLLDECPDCGGTDVIVATELDNPMDGWDDTDTVCRDCERVFDARGRLAGGYNNEVAKQLYEAFEKDLKRMISND